MIPTVMNAIGRPLNALGTSQPALFMMLFSLCTFANAQRKVEIVEPVKQSLADTGGRVIKRKVAIGRFSNETQYAKGIFSEDRDMTR